MSFSADGVIAIVYFTRSMVNHILGFKTLVPSELAKARAIDLSIQFTLFWMPFLVLLGWWIDKPMHLLFGAYTALFQYWFLGMLNMFPRLLRTRDHTRVLLPR